MRCVFQPKSKEQEDDNLGAMLYKTRDVTGDMTLVTTEKQEIKIHKLVLFSKSEWMRTNAGFGPITAIVNVDGIREQWDMIIQAMYNGTVVSTDKNDNNVLQALEIVDYYLFTDDVKRTLCNTLLMNAASILAVLIYAWGRKDVAFFENAVATAMEMSPKMDENWMRSWSVLKKQNPEIEKILNRTGTGVNWDAAVGPLWSHTMKEIGEAKKKKRKTTT
jgi:hypothetical protein